MTGRTGLARFSIWSRILSESYPLFLGQCFSQSSSVQSGWVRFWGLVREGEPVWSVLCLYPLRSLHQWLLARRGNPAWQWGLLLTHDNWSLFLKVCWKSCWRALTLTISAAWSVLRWGSRLVCNIVKYFNFSGYAFFLRLRRDITT